jgi:DNA-binding LytR/AlgR family response regulator
LKKKKVLVVEDELIIAVRLVKTLISLGYDACEPVSSADDAFKAIEDFSPDIVLMDIHIKGEICGIQLATLIKKKYAIPVVFLTAFSDEATIEQAKYCGAYGYIVKPFNNETLKVNIELALVNHSNKLEGDRRNQAIDKTISCFEDGIITTRTDFSVELMNKTVADLAGISTKKLEADRYHVNDLVIFYNTSNEKINLPDLLVQQQEAIRNEFTCYFPHSSLRKKFNITVHPIHLDGELFAWSFVFSLPESKIAKPAIEFEESMSAEPKPIKYIFSKKGKKYVRICIHEILWIEALDNYVIINTLKDKYIAHTTLKNIEETLPREDFLKVHRSYVVRIDKIDAWEDGYVLISGKSISVSRLYKDLVKDRLLLI